MSNGFDTILAEARTKIQTRQVREQEDQPRDRAAAEEAPSISPSEAMPPSTEEEKAKEHIRALLGRNFFRPNPPPKQQDQQSIEARRVVLISQAREIEPAEWFGRKN